MSARETILNAVRSGLGNTAVDPAAVRRDADALLQDGGAAADCRAAASARHKRKGRPAKAALVRNSVR